MRNLHIIDIVKTRSIVHMQEKIIIQTRCDTYS